MYSLYFSASSMALPKSISNALNMITPLHVINGPSNDITTQGRLIGLTGLLRTSEGHRYCRGTLVTNDAPGGRDIAFWNLSDTQHQQLTSLNNKCIQVGRVQSAAARPGYDSRARYALNFNGASSASSTQMRSAPTSVAQELVENPLWPADAIQLDTLSQVANVTSAVAIAPQSSQIPAMTVAPQVRRLDPPPDLVTFSCVHCGNGSSPTCGVTGAPHPDLCPDCGMLQAPVVMYCPMTGRPHTQF